MRVEDDRPRQDDGEGERVYQRGGGERRREPDRRGREVAARAGPGGHFFRGVRSRSGGGMSGSFHRMYGLSRSSWYAFAASIAFLNS